LKNCFHILFCFFLLGNTAGWCSVAPREGLTVCRAGGGLWAEGSYSLDFFGSFCVKTKRTSKLAFTASPDPSQGGGAQYNGNISAMRWRTARQVQQTYAFEYDGLSRLVKSQYAVGSGSNFSTNYTEQLSYDIFRQ
jgi:hypothetical protein